MPLICVAGGARCAIDELSTRTGDGGYGRIVDPRITVIRLGLRRFPQLELHWSSDMLRRAGCYEIRSAVPERPGRRAGGPGLPLVSSINSDQSARDKTLF